MVGTSMVYLLMVFDNMVSLFSFLHLSKMELVGVFTSLEKELAPLKNKQTKNPQQTKTEYMIQ